MIVKNEEQTIERVLACARTFCDEMVVVDTGSTDRTVEIAQQMGAKVYHFAWVEDFSAARNYSLDCCTGDWVLWLDADDMISEACQQRFREIKEQTLNDKLDAVCMPYYYCFDAQGNCSYTNIRERMFRRAAGLRWHHPIHEVVYVSSDKTLPLNDVWIEHRPLPDRDALHSGRNMRILEKSIENGDEHPRMIYLYARELKNTNQIEKAVLYYQKYLSLNPYGSRTRSEIYDVLMGMAWSYKKLGRIEESKDCLFKAINADSRRAEAYNELGFICYEKEDWEMAIPYFRTGANARKPLNEDLIADEHYTWLPNEYMSLCYAFMKDYRTALEIAIKCLPHHPMKENLIKNMHWFIDNI